MKVYSESKWVCGQCGRTFNPMECKLEIAETMIPKRVIIYCPNSECNFWVEICDVLEVK